MTSQFSTQGWLGDKCLICGAHEEKQTMGVVDERKGNAIVLERVCAGCIKEVIKLTLEVEWMRKAN
jgi:hypothetical protein